MKSYAYWPVKLKGLDTEAHITAAFLGSAPWDDQVCTVLRTLDTTFWQIPGIVHTEFNRNTHVLVLQAEPETHEVHRAFSVIRPHDFPEWKPHITVPYDYWIKSMLLAENPHDLIESIGLLMLRIEQDGVITDYTWDGVWFSAAMAP